MFTLHRNFFFGISHIWSEQVKDENKGIDSVFGDTSIPVVTVDLCKQFCWKQHPFLQRHASGRLRSYSISRAAPPLCNCSNGSSCSCGAAVAAATAGVLAPAAVAALLQQLLSRQQLLWPLPQQLLWQLSLQLWLQCF